MRIIAALLLAAMMSPLASPQQASSDLAPDSCGKNQKPFGSYSSVGGFAYSHSVGVFCTAPATPATRPGETRIVLHVSDRIAPWADSDTCPALREALTALSKAEPIPSPKPGEDFLVITGDGTDYALSLQLPLPGDTGESRLLRLADRAGDPHPAGFQKSAGLAIVQLEQKLAACWRVDAPP